MGPPWAHARGKALRTGDFKAVALSRGGEGWVLYDLRNDRAEQIDLSEQHPERLRGMIETGNALDARFEADVK